MRTSGLLDAHGQGFDDDRSGGRTGFGRLHDAMRAVHAVIFDLDNTLWDVGPVIIRAEHAMIAFLADRYPRALERHTLETMRDMRARMAVEHPAMRHDFTWLRMQALRVHAREAGCPETMAGEAFEVFYRARNEVVLYDDVLPTLARLCGRFRLLAISNGNASLADIGLAQYFDLSLAAREAGMLKPDPRIFAMLLERARLGPGDVLHVGDDAVADVQGARQAGIEPVWLNRGGEPWPGCLQPPSVTIRSLHELANLLC